MADIASEGHWKHVSDVHELIFPSSSFDEQLRVEIFGDILYEHFPISHFVFPYKL